MLTAIGLTLIFAGLTSALGLRRAVAAHRRGGARSHGLFPALTSAAMALWFTGAGVWALTAR